MHITVRTLWICITALVFLQGAAFAEERMACRQIATLSKEADIRDIFRSRTDPSLVLMENGVYACPCEQRQFSGDNENRLLNGSSEKRMMGGFEEKRIQAGDLETRSLNGQEEERKTGGQDEKRRRGGASEKRNAGGDVEARMIGGNADRRTIGGGMQELSCSLDDDCRGYLLQGVNANVRIRVYDGITLKELKGKCFE